MTNPFNHSTDSIKNNPPISENFCFLFVLDLTSSLRFEAKREIMKQSVIIPIIQQYTSNNMSCINVAFAGLTGSISLGLLCTVLKTFKTKTDSKSSFRDFLAEIDRFLSKEIDKIVDFGLTGDSLTGSFGIGGTIEAICISLCHFPESVDNCKKHLILLPTSSGTEILPHFRTCPDDNYAAAPLPQLLSIFRTRKISLSLVAPGLSDSTVVEQFIVFKCNEKIGNAARMTEALGPDWVVRLSANLTGDDVSSVSVTGIVGATGATSSVTATKASTTNTPTNLPSKIDENELLNQTLIKLASMPPDERVIALKTLLDPTTSTFSSSFRQKFAAAVKSRLQSQETQQASQQQTSQQVTQRPGASRRASQDSSTNFWSGCIRFTEKQQTFLFRVQFVAVDSQTPLPRASLENWPPELNLTGLLDSKKESIQSGLNVGYAFRVNVASADNAVASYLMTRMCQGPPPNSNTNSLQGKQGTPSHLACFRISQDVLIMLRVLSHDDLQFIGYLIDRRFPKNNLTPAAQAASNAINSLTAMKSPMSTTLSTGMDGLSLGRRPSFDVKINSFPTVNRSQAQSQQLQSQSQVTQLNSHSNTHSNSQSQQQQKQPSTITTNYMSYPQFMQQQRSPAKIAAISSTTVTTSQLLTDPQAILQKLRPVASVQRNSSMMEPIPPPQPQTNQQEQVAVDDQELAQSFVDAWLN